MGPPLRQPVEGRRWHVRRQRRSSPPPNPLQQTPPHSPCAGRAEPPRKARPASRRGRGSGGAAMQGRPAALPTWRTKKHLWQGCNATIGTDRAGGGVDRGPPRCRAATAGREVEDGGAYGRVNTRRPQEVESGGGGLSSMEPCVESRACSRPPTETVAGSTGPGRKYYSITSLPNVRNQCVYRPTYNRLLTFH